MILGIGTDLLDLRRAEVVVTRHGNRAIQRIMRPSERAFYAGVPERVRGFAKVWAYKEAMIKALGCRPSPFSWLDLEVSHTPSGRPSGRFYGAALHLLQSWTSERHEPPTVFLTLSDEFPYIIATCIIEGHS